MAPAATTAPPVLLTTRQAAADLAISEGHLKNLTAAGVIPFVSLGRSIRYRRCDIEAAVSKLVKQATSK